MSDAARALILAAFPHATFGEHCAHADDFRGKAVGRSLVINYTGGWRDHETSKSGRDFNSLLAQRGGDPEQWRELIDAAKAEAASDKPKVVPIRAGIVASSSFDRPKEIRHHEFGVPNPENVFAYRTRLGAYLGFCCRFDVEDGRKEIRYYVYAAKKGSQPVWSWKSFPKPLPLYNLDILHDPANSSLPVLIVEGEKTANAIDSTKRAVVIAVPGGTNAVGYAAWTDLQGRDDIVVLMDNDAAGRRAAEVIATRLRGLDCNVRVVPPEAVASALGVRSVPDKWDVADVVGVEPEAIVEAILAEAAKLPDPDPDPFNYTDQHKIKATPANALAAVGLAKDLGVVFNLDTKKLGFRRAPDWRTEKSDLFTELEDVDIISLTANLRGRHEVDFPANAVRDALAAVGMANKFSPWQDWLEGLVWDKEPRLDMLFENLGCPSMNAVRETRELTEEERLAERYAEFVAPYMFCALAVRIFHPGTQVDMMVVLEGEQGLGKSRFVKTLAGQHLDDVDRRSYASLNLPQLEGHHEKDAQMIISGAIVVEIEEIARGRAADETIKRFITLQRDQFRPPYGAIPVSYDRRCLLIGTTNRHDYLKDETGNRRYLPFAMKVGPNAYGDCELDIAYLEDNREQLFAEAVARMRECEAASTNKRSRFRSLLEVPRDLQAYHKEVLGERFIEDPMVEPLRRFFANHDFSGNKDRALSISVILEGALEMKPEHHSAAKFNQAKSALRHLDLRPVRVKVSGGFVSMYHIPAGKFEKGASFAQHAAANSDDDTGRFPPSGDKKDGDDDIPF